LCNYFCYPFSFKKFSCVRRIVRVFCFLLLLLGKQRHVSWFVFFFSTWVIFFFLFMSALAMQTLFSHIRSCRFFHGSISFGLWRWVFIFILHNGWYFSTSDFYLSLCWWVLFFFFFFTRMMREIRGHLCIAFVMVGGGVRPRSLMSNMRLQCIFKP
jgi:hypothetical protein